MDSAKKRNIALQALAEFTKSTSFELGEVAKTLTDESDRGVVVISGSITEDLLLSRIFENFVEMPNEARRNLTRSGGVLSTWADRTNIARALGIIDDDDVAILETLKAMRNACAHSRKHIDFQTSELVNVLCLSLNEKTEAELRAITDPNIRRMAFTTLVSYIWGRIGGQSKAESNARCQAMVDSAIAEAQRISSQKKPSKPRRKAKHPAPKGKAPPRQPRSSPK